MGDNEDEQLRKGMTTGKESNFQFLGTSGSVSPRNFPGTSVRLIMSFFGRLILSFCHAHGRKEGPKACSSNCILHLPIPWSQYVISHSPTPFDFRAATQAGAHLPDGPIFT